ncbi:hypothetical protein Slin15195_G076680 [Septoria linicola]|uniref:Uncharacterized protein n=1 Tax=Septoria linicola TaxID=215465 RepID=A0A9Q9AS03_9PEZI|nr:hypothetical protein Slin15195_G076680 [Septoria linicola]
MSSSFDPLRPPCYRSEPFLHQLYGYGPSTGFGQNTYGGSRGGPCERPPMYGYAGYCGGNAGYREDGRSLNGHQWLRAINNPGQFFQRQRWW